MTRETPENHNEDLESTAEFEPLPPDQGLPPVSRLEIAALSDLGKARPNNEDQYLVGRLRKTLEVLDTTLREPGQEASTEQDGYVLVVADGLGGAAAGEYASAAAVKAVKHHMMYTSRWFFNLDDPDEKVRIRLLRESLEHLDRELLEKGEENPSLAGMGTTLTAACLVADEVFIVNVGDSRAYQFSSAGLEQLTRDDTVAQELVEAGIIEPQEARSHRLRHILTNAVGGRPGIRCEIVKVRLGDGDRLLLCTDGLTEMVSDDRIAQILASEPRPDKACRALVTEALQNGGHDNVTVIVANHSRIPG